MGNTQGAYDLLVDVEHVIGPDGDTLEHATLYDHRALLRGLDNDGDGALDDLSRSRIIREVHGDNEGLVVVHKLIGNVYLRYESYAAARDEYELALTLPSTDANEKHKLEAETSLAVCDLVDDRAEAAETRLMEVIVRARERHYEAGLARARVTLALVLERQERVPEALAAVREVIAADPGDPDIARAAQLIEWRLELDGAGATG